MGEERYWEEHFEGKAIWMKGQRERRKRERKEAARAEDMAEEVAENEDEAEDDGGGEVESARASKRLKYD